MNSISSVTTVAMLVVFDHGLRPVDTIEMVFLSKMVKQTGNNFKLEVTLLNKEITDVRLGHSINMFAPASFRPIRPG